MRAFGYQKKSYDCGLHAFSNAVKVWGIELDYEEAKELVGTTSRNGTSETGILQGITKVGLRFKEYSQCNPDTAWRWLLKWSQVCPIIAYTNTDHWVTITGRVQNRVIIVDPNAAVDDGENGVYPLTKREMLQRWRDGRDRCYAIRVFR